MFLKFQKIKNVVKILVFPLMLLLLSFSYFSAATTSVNAQEFVDCSKVEGNVMNIKCMTQIVGARCFIPDADKNCEFNQSILGAIFNFLVAFGPIVAVMIIAYGGYQYYFSGFSGNAKGGRQAIIAGVTGLIIILAVAMYKQFILGFTANESATGADQTTYNNLGERIVSVVIVPIVQVMRVGAAAFAVISIVFAGYWYIVGASTGDSNASKKGITGVKNALIGILLVILSITLIQLLSNFVGSFK